MSKQHAGNGRIKVFAAVFTLTLIAGPSSAQVVPVSLKTSPLSPIAGPAASAGAFGASNLGPIPLGLSNISASALPRGPAISPAPSVRPVLRVPAGVKPGLERVSAGIAKAKTSGASFGGLITRTYDGSAKSAARGVSAGPVLGHEGTARASRLAGHLLTPVMPATAGLPPRQAAADESRSDSKPAPAVETPAVRDADEPAPLNWRRAAAGFLLWLGLVGLVALEYGGLYYAFTHAPAAQRPSYEQPLPPGSLDDLRDWGF